MRSSRMAYCYSPNGKRFAKFGASIFPYQAFGIHTSLEDEISHSMVEWSIHHIMLAREDVQQRLLRSREDGSSVVRYSATSPFAQF
jgi:hypothetical protein